MPDLHPVPASQFVDDDFLTSLRPDHLVYFLLNVGDADAQLLLLPENGDHERAAVVVDAGRTKKVPWLLDALEDADLLPKTPKPTDAEHYPEPDGSIPLVVATHPHKDHILGMSELLHEARHRITDFWDPGYYATIPSYISTMSEVELNPHLRYAQPTSGFRKWIGDVLFTVMSPSIQLRSRFDTYGTEINDSSISLRVEFPASRVVQRSATRELVDEPTRMSLMLGADAQTLSWSYVLTDFPHLPASETAAADAIKAATGKDLLDADVMKVSHHCSKRGVNLELMERICPRVTLISSTWGGKQHKFPHDVAQNLIREALDPVAKSGKPHRPDWKLNLFCTGEQDDTGAELGTIALVLSATSITKWRFCDLRNKPVDLTNSWRLT